MPADDEPANVALPVQPELGPVRTAAADTPGGMTRRPRLSGAQRFFFTRILVFPISILAIVTLSFALVTVTPGDIAQSLDGPEASAQQIAATNHRLGLDQPIGPRYLTYIGGVVHGDLGTSFFSGLPVAEELGSRLPATLDLIVPALLLALVLGLALGTLGAYYARRPVDTLTRFLLTLIQSVPDFLLALLLIVVLFTVLHVAPGPSGTLPLADTAPPHVTGSILVDTILAGQWGTLIDAIKQEILPVVTLGIVYSVAFGRTTRAVLGSALASEYVRFGRACGLSEWRLVRNALLVGRTSLLTYGAIILAGLIGGDAIVEIVFSWNGVGQYAVQSIQRLDIPAVQGFVLLSGSVTLVLFFALDLLSARLDPRITFNAQRR